MANVRLDTIILLSLLLVSLWVSTQFGQLQGQSETAFVANVYTLMCLVAIVGAFAADKSFSFFKFIPLNVSGTALIALLAMGALIGFFTTSEGKALLVPKVSASIDPSLAIAFVIILAPFVEEYFFRAFLFPSFEGFFGSRAGISFGTLAGALISSALFTAWHFVAYANDPSAFLPLFIYALVQCGMVKLSNSIAPAIGSHFILNLLTH